MKNLDDILTNMVTCGIIPLNDIRSLSKEELMNKILQQYHKYKITKTTDGKWTTYVEDTTRPQGRRLVKKKKETDLYLFLLEFYNLVL